MPASTKLTKALINRLRAIAPTPPEMGASAS